ncbi:hypothetical protein [Amycolatopsis keratiniphila]|nr:hypothetical protein [Amycolatopsis keratiniphila]
MRERPTTRLPEPHEQKPVVAEDLTVALEPLDRSVLVRRAVDIFPAGYLTIISIIQGVALSVLLAETVPLVIDGGRGAAAVVATFAQALLAFVAIVVVAYEYLWFTTLMRWVPTFRDTVVPLLLGVGEIVPAFLMERWTAWWVVMTIFIGLGGGAYLNTITRLRRELFAGGDQIRRRISGLLWQLVGQCAAGVLLGVATWQVVRAWPGSAAVVTTIGATALTMLIGGWMVFVSERMLNEVFKRHGIQRRPLRPTWEHTGWMPRN